MRDKEAEEYLRKVKDILTSSRSGSRYLPRGPSQLLDHLYIGNKEDAHNITILKVHKISHVLNCAAKRDYSMDSYGQTSPYSKAGIAYEEFEGCDNDGYPILMHFARAKLFIDEAKRTGGRALVHCEMGINRSGAICIAYMMVNEKITMLQALRSAKIERPTILVNEGFQKMLVEFARERGLM